MPDWKKAGNLLVSEATSLKELIEKDMSYVLIDLRMPETAGKGHIKGAVSVPLKELTNAKDRFPSDKSAPVILYSDASAADAFRTVRSWGYPNVTILNGGVDGWKNSGGQLEKGGLATDIVYIPKPRPGEIPVEEFKSLAEKSAADNIIIDVRDEDEAMNGMLKGAMNIPSGKIKERLSEIPKDKELIVHCVTGIRAEMAYNTLKESGYKVRFLNAVIQIDKDGKYEITKK